MSRRIPFLVLPLLVAACGDDSGGAPPQARFSHECIEFVCTFDASETTGSGQLTYFWEFGDGATGGGRVATHAYTKSGSMQVRLTVIDNDSQGSATSAIDVTGNPAATHYSAIHDSIATLLLLQDMLPTLVIAIDAVQDETEARGAPAAGGYTFDCPQGGTAEIRQWEDANNSLAIDGNEILEFSASSCRFADGKSALTTYGDAMVSGDFDGTAFSIGHAESLNGRFNIGAVGRWAVQGPIDLQVVHDAGVRASMSYASDNLNIVYLSDAGAVAFSYGTNVQLQSPFGSLADLHGEWSISFPGTTTSRATTDPDDGMTISGGGALRLSAGGFSLLRGDTRIDLTPDADPDYVALAVDADNDGSVETNTRFLQSVTLERFNY